MKTHKTISIPELAKKYGIKRNRTSSQDQTTYSVTVQQFNIMNLRVDPNYQRDVNPALVKKIRAKLDLDSLMIPLVFTRDEEPGVAYIVEGQQRILALYGEGFNLVDCLVVTGEDWEREVDIFLKINRDRRRPPSATEHKCKFHMGDLLSIEMDKAVVRGGFEIDEKDLNRQIKSPSKIKHIARTYRASGGGENWNLVSVALSIYRQIWPSHGKASGNAIAGIAAFIWAAEKAGKDHLTFSSRLKNCFGNRWASEDDFEEAVKANAGKKLKGSDMDKAYASTLLKFFNSDPSYKGQRKQKLPTDMLDVIPVAGN